MNCNNCKNKETAPTGITTTAGPISGENQVNYQNYAQYGWICPRCGKVNAPWMATCSCSSWGSYWTSPVTAAPSARPVFHYNYTGVPTDISTSTNIDTSTVTAINDYNKALEEYNKTLEESDSIFDAYKDYNNYLNVKEEHGRFKQ